MDLSYEQFIRLVEKTIDELPEKFAAKVNNVAIFVEDYPTKEQLKKAGIKNDFTLFGLFEGFAQGRRINLGPVLPDRITIFRKPILSNCTNESEAKRQIISTVKHEIAHHFGMDEVGARKAGKIRRD
jgi:predicted Zn-dependent protease with MMP-like domain